MTSSSEGVKGAVRTKFIDYNARREPKTGHWCFMCQRDLKIGQPYRLVSVVDGCLAVHPDGPQPSMDNLFGVFALGMECAKKLGLEWSRSAQATPEPKGAGL